MADAGLYTNARSLFLAGALNWTSVDGPLWRLLLLTPDYVVDREAHRTIADISPAALISTSGDILQRTISGGVARAASVITLGGNIGQEVSQVVVVCGDNLVWWSDNCEQLPYTADGGTTTIVWDAVALGPFEL